MLGKKMCAKKVNMQVNTNIYKTNRMAKNITSIRSVLYNPLCSTQAISQEAKGFCQTLWEFLDLNSGRNKFLLCFCVSLKVAFVLALLTLFM